MNGVSGTGSSISTCQALLLVGNITLYGQFQKPQLLYPAWALLVGQSSPPKAKWDRAKNVDVLGVELAGSAVQLPLVWNIQVSTWLRYCKFCFLIKSIASPTLLTCFVG